MGEKNLKRFEKRLRQYHYIALDSVCFIYHIEENKRYVPLTQIIFENLLPKGVVRAFFSTLVLTEILTRPIAEKRQELVFAYKSLIASFPHTKLIPLDEENAQKAAFFRAKYQLRTPDAIHIATAYQAGADAVICNDTKWKKVKEIPVITLDAFVS